MSFRPRVEILEDRTLLSPVLTVTNLTVSGSNGTLVSNFGTWFDDPGATLSLTASAGNVTRNTDGTWSWSFATPTGPPLSQAVTITGDDGGGYKAFVTFYLNPTLRTVSNTNDSGAGSLREAILDTNNDTAGVDEIVFAITGAGPFTIQPATPFDPISIPVFINGTTESGWKANDKDLTGTNSGYDANLPIVLDGGGGQYDGLLISGGNSTVLGLAIQNFGTDIHLTTIGNDQIAGNYLADGSLFIDNVANNIVGGATAAARNVISSVDIDGAAANNNVLEGNYIGTDGSKLIEGTNPTIYIWASNNVVGGTATGAGNVIAGSAKGIQTDGDPGRSSSGNLVQGNYIGLDAAGTAVLPGLGRFGIALGVNSNNNTIGGTTPSARNIISGWAWWEVALDNQGPPLPSGDVFEGNFIGTNADGSTCFPVATAVGIETAVNSIVSGNVIKGCGQGGVVLGSDGGQVTDNTIAFNGVAGVNGGASGIQIKGNVINDNGGPGVEGTGQGTGNQIEGNSIYGNALLGIDLRNDGVTANQPGGPFIGPNNYTFSGIVTEDDSGAMPMLTVSGSLQGLANTVYTINSLRIYNTAAPSYGFDVGPGNTLVFTDASGSASFSIRVVRPDLTPFIDDAMGWTLTGVDAMPPHFGPNYLQNYPVLTSATCGASTVVTGTLNGQASTSFTVDVYANPIADPSGYGQGQYYLGSVPVTTDKNGPPDVNGKPSGNASFTYTFSTANLPAALLAAPWYISTTATDNGGNTSEFSKDVCIPVAGVTGPSDGVPGQPRTFTLSANASALDQPAGFTFNINWGDGTTQTVQGLSGVKVDHVYAGTGTFTMSVTATDLDGGISSAVSQAIAVQRVVMEGNSLAVGGTLGNDTITLTPADTAGDITVNLNGTTSFNGVTTFKPTDHILVYGQSGNDTIQLVSKKIAGTTYYITVPAIIYGGGTGHEILSVTGSTANNVVIGGGGTNQITGGLGRDLLIAGLGASKLFAGSAGDILIGGWTDYDLTSTAMTYDQKLAALEAIMAEWGSADSYTTRVSDLTNGGGLNGSDLLNASTVHDNGQVDTLSGITAASPLDWFFASAADIIKHKNSGEATTTIQ
jgi:hypothetical protein